MTDILIPGFDIALTAASGQCFRFNRIGDTRFRVIASGRRLEIEDLGAHRFRPDCDEQTWRSFWHDYFDMDRDYAAVMAAVPEDDMFLREAAAFAGGLRILRQDPWETLIGFIISQRKNLPAIKGCVEALSVRFGSRIDGETFAFPTPGQLAQADIEDLRACALGYRAPYIQQTARMAASGLIDLDALKALDDADLQVELMRFPGVGVKVADCVMLFGYSRTSAFPRDVWINRVLDRYYHGESPAPRLGANAGILQQCMFCYIRSL